MKHITLTLLLTASISYGKVGLDLVGLSMGPWITLNSSTGPDTKDSYFSTASLSMYMHGYGFKGAVFLPVTWSVEKYATYSRYAVYPSDIKFYIGKRVKRMEPRIGLVIPTTYPTDNSAAWISSGNYKLLLGSGFHLGRYANRKLSIGGEFQATYYLNGIDNGARFGSNSISGYASLKASWKHSNTVKTGLELFPKRGYYTEVDWHPGHSFSSFGLLPMAFIQISPMKRGDVGLKAGYGWESTGGRRSAIISGSLAFHYYL